MRLLFTFVCVATCLTIGARLAWNALELGNWSNNITTCSVADLIPSQPASAPIKESTAVLDENSLAPTIMLPKTQVLDKLNRPTRGSFGGKNALLPLSTIDRAILVPRSSRVRAFRASSGSSTNATPNLGAREAASRTPSGADRINPLTAMLNTRNYVKPDFSFTSHGNQNTGTFDQHSGHSGRRVH